MVRLPRCLVLLGWLILISSASAAEVDNFYEQQLRAGRSDFQANRIPQAADELRIAAFGFLDRPQLLSEALVRLAVAQKALGQDSLLTRTIERFVEVEQRFAPYATLQIEPPIKQKFEEILVKSVPRATLANLPAVARLVNYDVEKLATLPEGQRVAAYREGARREPKNPQWPLALAREAAGRDASADVIHWATRVLEIEPSNREARALMLHARVSRHECREALLIVNSLDVSELQQRPEIYADETVCFADLARWADAQAAMVKVPESLKNRPDVVRAAQLIAKNVKAANTSMSSAEATPMPSRAPGEVLDVTRRLVRDGKYGDAAQRLRAAVDSDPKNRELRLALLEAAVLAQDWRTAASQVSFVMPLNTGEELYMFYASVAMYETGKKEEAKQLMQRARPRMVPSPMVDYYVRVVLGQRG